MNVSEADLESLSQNALLKLVNLASSQEARLQKECESLYLKMRSLDREFEDLAHPLIKTKRTSEQEARDAVNELKRLEDRVKILRHAESFGKELRPPENGAKDDVTRRIGLEVKEVNDVKAILKKLVGKKGIRRGYEEVKKEVANEKKRESNNLKTNNQDDSEDDDPFNY